MEYSINALLSMEKSLRQRLNQLNEIKNSSARITRYFDSGSENRVDEPTYKIQVVDKMIVEINRALFKVDQKIKESNAATKIDVAIDYDALTAEIPELEK